MKNVLLGGTIVVGRFTRFFRVLQKTENPKMHVAHQTPILTVFAKRIGRVSVKDLKIKYVVYLPGAHKQHTYLSTILYSPQ